jgi:hypothetical protein
MEGLICTEDGGRVPKAVEIVVAFG